MPGDEMAGATPVGQRPREAEEHEVAAWNEGCRQSAVGNFDCRLAREGRIRNRRQGLELDHMIVAEARSPAGVQRSHFLPQARANAELDGVALAVIEPNRFNARKPFQRPGQTYG